MRSLLGRPDILILDARPEVFHRAGHIQGAYSFPREEFSTQFPKYEPALRDPHLTGIVIYCSGGECEDSAALAQYLSAKEIGPLAIFTGGWEEWSADESTDAPGK
jgi:predicted sulfurtransferase